MGRSSDETPRPFQGLPRASRLKKQSLIRPLFDRARDDVHTISRGSIRVLYRTVRRSEAETSAPVQVGFAPGRASKAVTRNRIKRILREVYRIHQTDLVDLFSRSDETLTLMILHRGPEHHRGPQHDADELIRRDLPKVIKRLRQEILERTSAAQ